MPRGTRPTVIVAVTMRVARSMTETLLPPRFVIQSSVPRGCTATPHGPSPTGTVTVTVPVARFTRETVSSRKLLTAAIAKLLRQATVSGAVGVSQRPPWQTSSPLHTSPSLQLVPSGSIWQVGEQQSAATVVPSSHVSPAAASTIPSPHTEGGAVVVVVVVLDDDATVVEVVVVLAGGSVDVVVVTVVDVVVDVVVVVLVVLVVVLLGWDSTSVGTQSSRRSISLLSSGPKRFRVKTSTSPKRTLDRVR